MTNTESYHTYPCIQTDSCWLFFAFKFVAHWGDIRKVSNCIMSVHTDWNINVSFIIHVDFKHTWAKHYPVIILINALALVLTMIAYQMAILKHKNLSDCSQSEF